MKKLKLLVLGIGILTIGAIGVSYFGSSEVIANEKDVPYCQWDGEGCTTPVVDNYCGCE